MHRFSFIECLNATTCFQRNTFLQPAWNGINFTAQKSSLTTGYGRFYIINEQGDGYHPFFLKNRQISFTVDVSNVPCMTDAALYVSSFDPVAKLADPGDFDYRASPPTGGYCDAQGFDGSACMEMDIFEGNSAATQVTTHTCSQRTCNSFDACDHAGCGVNSRHMPQIGPDGTVVSTRLAFKVLTRFELDNGTVGGDLVRIVQTLRQGNRIVQSAVLHDKACVPQFGGIPKVGTALGEGMAMILSFWNLTGYAGDTWLDGGTGNPRCSRIANQDVTVKFANIVISPLS
ncbi:concanavalin A-like lectin/glucanase domain-containing protein [Chytriomyces sp. MP71]|nr:concanavalin A-like lectin/glucanase domain-containing protein [Chytriomyces sp. MP71]